MGLKFRRGSTAQQSGSLAFGEPYVNTTLGTLVVGGASGDIILSSTGTGSTGNFGAISGSGLDITGNANIGGNLTLGGAITIGDATADTVNVVASLSSSLIPQTTNAFDLGSVSKIWRDLYISTGSIKVVSNGTVVSTLSTNADGSQNFPNGLTVSGSLKVSGSVNIGETAYIKDTFGSIHMYTSGANYNNGGEIRFGGISGSASTGVDNFISFNGAPHTAASNTSVTVWGANDGGGAAIFLNRKSSQGVESWGYTPWTIGVDLGATSTPNGLYIGTGNTFLNRSIEFNYKGLNPNILFSGSGIIPAAANTYDLGTPTKPWREIYVSTGSINFVNNGTVVSTLSANGDGSQNFPNGLYSQANIQIGDGSYLDAGKFQVGRRGTSPDQNVVLGIDIMPSLTSGVGNVGLGRTSLYRLTTGNSNIGIGSGAGYGISGSNNNNIAIGYGTAFFMTGSNVDQNVFLGTNAATNLNDGIYNTAIGGNALLGSANSNDTPTKSTALGYSAGAYLIGNSTNNLLLGANAGPSSNTEESYKFYVSNGDTGQQSFMLGNMANGSRTLSINAATTISGSVTGTSFNGTINANNGVLSGSLQAQLPAGVVSGSSQVTLSSTTGYGSILNQPVLTTSSPTFAGLTITGSITATGDVVAYSTSDKRHKNTIVLISDALSKVSKLNGVTWEWNDDVDSVTKETPKTGLIAQEVQEVLPEVVKERGDGFLALDYSKMMGLMVEAIKELSDKVKELENK